MTWIFVFLGEFGYELFNWQGVVRKFARGRRRGERIVCVSRAELDALYESADLYVELSDLPRFRGSVASGYFALHRPGASLGAPEQLRFERELKREIRNRVDACLDGRPGGWRRLLPRSRRYVFSSDLNLVRGCRFGCDRRRFGVDLREGDIYERLDLGNNVYRRIDPDPAVLPVVRRKLGFDPQQPFILVQTRMREIVQRSNDCVDWRPLVEELARRMRVVLLSFETGRRFDSRSVFPASDVAAVYPCASFREQAWLVRAARTCVFFTEGDFGSHIYVPPFLGRDVVAVAPRSVYRLGTTPIDFWNRHVFRFGGQIVPLVAEEALATAEAVRALADRIAGGDGDLRASTDSAAVSQGAGCAS